MQEVCDLIAQGMLVKDAAAKANVSPRAVREWGLTDEFAPLYARARESQAHALAEDVLAIADAENPHKGPDASAYEAHRRTRVDTRKWYTSKIAPKLYGEKMNHEHTGKDGGTIEVIVKRDQAKAE